MLHCTTFAVKHKIRILDKTLTQLKVHNSSLTLHSTKVEFVKVESIDHVTIVTCMQPQTAENFPAKSASSKKSTSRASHVTPHNAAHTRSHHVLRARN